MPVNFVNNFQNNYFSVFIICDTPLLYRVTACTAEHKDIELKPNSFGDSCFPD